MMRRPCILIVSAIVALVAVEERPVAQQAPNGSVFVGILRSDALLLPIAINDGRDWWNAWPFSDEGDESVQGLPLPGSLDTVPENWLPPGTRLPREWRVQMVRGGDRIIHLGRPARPARFSMAAMIALETDYGGRRTADDQDIDSEDGVAVAGRAALGRFTGVPDTTARALVAAMSTDLFAAESREIAFRIKERESAPDWDGKPVVFPADEQQRMATPFSSYGFTRAVRTEPAGTFYVFQGQKDYGRRPWPDCAATVDFSGIVVQDSGGHVSVRSMGAYTTLECSRDNALAIGFEPLASLHWRGPTLWIVRLQAEDGFEYGLLNPADADPSAMPMRGAWQLQRDSITDASRN
ncbi:MAG TPA: hypothetical protein VFX12_12665 [Vicinamibacterales bacterium]|nr:hypothetical protein [Vicinamibacterales bacterium]